MLFSGQPSLLYGLYLLLFFQGTGHYSGLLLRVRASGPGMGVRFFRDRSAYRATQQAAAVQMPSPVYGQQAGYGQQPGYEQQMAARPSQVSSPSGFALMPAAAAR